MRNRSTAFLLALAAVVAVSLASAAPAVAADRQLCRSESHKTLTQIVCESAPTSRPVAAIAWLIDNRGVQAYNNRVAISFYCQLGRAYNIDNVISFTDGNVIVESQRILCKFNPR